MKRLFESEMQEAAANVPVKCVKSCEVDSKRSATEKGDSHCDHDCRSAADDAVILPSPDLNSNVSQPEICDPLDLVDDTKSNSVEKEIEDAIFALATKRGDKKTLCPSEIPRLILKFKNWRDYMDLTRTVAFRMAHSGIVDVMQKGKRINTDEFDSVRGPIRLQLRRFEQTVETL